MSPPPSPALEALTVGDLGRRRVASSAGEMPQQDETESAHVHLRGLEKALLELAMPLGSSQQPAMPGSPCPPGWHNRVPGCRRSRRTGLFPVEGMLHVLVAGAISLYKQVSVFVGTVRIGEI